MSSMPMLLLIKLSECTLAPRKLRSALWSSSITHTQEVVNASYILAEEQREKNEQLGQKVVDTVTGVKSVFKQKKTPKDVTPPGGK